MLRKNTAKGEERKRPLSTAGGVGGEGGRRGIMAKPSSVKNPTCFHERRATQMFRLVGDAGLQDNAPVSQLLLL